MTDTKRCGEIALFRYTWPGKDEAVCCKEHAEYLVRVADAIGTHLQVIQLSAIELVLGLRCTSCVEK